MNIGTEALARQVAKDNLPGIRFVEFPDPGEGAPAPPETYSKLTSFKPDAEGWLEAQVQLLFTDRSELPCAFGRKSEDPFSFLGVVSFPFRVRVWWHADGDVRVEWELQANNYCCRQAGWSLHPAEDNPMVASVTLARRAWLGAA